jgi:hypothetical protein
VLLFDIADRRTHRYFIGGRYRGARRRVLQKAGAVDPAQLGGEHASQLQAIEDRRKADDTNLERMIAYGQTALCRWRALLDHFNADGVAADFRCGTCDTCQKPIDLPVAI